VPIQFFDKITFKLTGKQFSIPSQIDTSCYYAKPYHFWMAAYMAHDAVINGKFNKRDAVVATHLLGVGYELGRIDEKYTRKTYDWLPLGIEKQFSPAANAARIDLVYNTMGAWFGAIHLDLDSNTKKLNATSALFRIFMKSNALRSIFLGIRSVRVIDFLLLLCP
jgi:hypothetical protein